MTLWQQVESLAKNGWQARAPACRWHRGPNGSISTALGGQAKTA